MVCEKCEKSWAVSSHRTRGKMEPETLLVERGRKLNENKALTSKREGLIPMGNPAAICRICKSSVHQAGSNFCQGCAYKKGICAMCGKKVLDTKNYKQTSV